MNNIILRLNNFFSSFDYLTNVLRTLLSICHVLKGVKNGP